jgi:hypothetical protein
LSAIGRSASGWIFNLALLRISLHSISPEGRGLTLQMSFALISVDEEDQRKIKKLVTRLGFRGSKLGYLSFESQV